MAIWKKILVSGSSVHVNAITASSLTNDNFIIVGPNGELQDSGLTYDGSVVTLTGAKLIVPGDISGSGDVKISGSVVIDTNLTVSGTTTLTGDTELDGNVVVGGDLSAVGDLGITGNAKITGSLEVDGISTFDGAATFNSGVTITGANNLRVGGDLIVDGDFTYLNTANLFVEDKFILLNSGSANPDEGGLIIDEGGSAGHAFVYDSDAARFAFTGSLAHNATSVVPDAFVAAVVHEGSGHTDKAEYQKAGNIKVDSSNDIWIYV